VHFPFDVAAGVLLALVLGTAAHLFLLQLRRLLEFLVQGLARRAGLLAVREVPPRNR
jgi:membrane-associated phospholipid phosphatase